MIWFLDNTNPPAFGPVLQALSYDARHIIKLPEHFAAGGSTKDEIWIPVIGGLGWITVTADRRLATDKAQRALLTSYRLTIFFLPAGFTKLARWPQLELFIKAWPYIEHASARSKLGDWYDVARNGKVTSMVSE